MAQKKDSAALGRLGEGLGCRYLEEKGYRILGRGYTNKKGYRLGEIDIIAKKGGKIVFVEVKTRLFKPGRVFVPEENITKAKLRKLERIARAYLAEYRLDSGYSFDALAIVYYQAERRAEIRHLEGIFL